MGMGHTSLVVKQACGMDVVLSGFLETGVKVHGGDTLLLGLITALQLVLRLSQNPGGLGSLNILGDRLAEVPNFVKAWNNYIL